MRPIANIVDVTNYVMLGLGNPLHAFDYAELAGGKIVVRRALLGEKLRTLDGVERDLDPSDLMIADAERSIALAGIIGGEETEITEATTEVLLEAANFEPTGIWRTSERLRLRTEGSNRWEKGVDPYLAEHAAIWATELIVGLSGARWVGHTDVSGDLPERPVVRFRPEKASALIGLEVASEEQSDILARLGNERRDGEYVVPTWRARDLTREVDLIEEVARFRLADVPFTLPVRREMVGRLTRTQRLRRRVEDTLAALGFSEVYTASLVGDDADPEALSATRAHHSRARDDAHGAPAVLDRDSEAKRRGRERACCPLRDRAGLPATRRCRAARGEDAGGRNCGGRLRSGEGSRRGASPLRCTQMHRGRGPRIACSIPGSRPRIEAGLVGELHPALLEGAWGAFELDVEILALAARDPVPYEDVITFPAVFQDIAVTVGEEVEVGALVDAAHDVAGSLLREARVFDVYRGEQVGPGRKSVAIHLSFQSPERTLTDDEASEARAQIVAALAERFDAELRT